MVRKIYELCLMSLLIVSIFYLGLTNKLKLLINPRYFIFIYLALIILLIFIIISVLSPLEKKGKTDFKSSYILILIIISLMFSTSYKNFQSSLTELKGISLPTDIDTESDIKTNITTQKNIIETKPKKVDSKNIIINDENYYETIDKLYRNMDGYIGTSINIKGFVSNFNGLDPNHFVLSRMIMICCAADSSVCGLICDISDVQFDFEENMWYEITGLIEKQNVTIDSYSSDNPVIRVTGFTPIEPLEDPYIYPNFF